MNKKKIILIVSIAVVVLIAGIVAGLVVNHMREAAEEAERLRIYHETYLIMDGEEYLRATTELDLSGKQIAELHKLQELTALQKLDLRDTGITAEQHDTLQAALPGCEILWSVPFQGGTVDCTVQELVLEQLSEQDLSALAYLRALTAVNADSCRDYSAIFALMEQYPDVAVTYTVPIGELTVSHTAEELTVFDPNTAELLLQIPRLPNLKNVTLEGKLPSTEELLELKNTLPNVTFLWNFTVCGVETNSLAEFIDLSDIRMDTTDELEAALPCFYNLTKVDMINCGLSYSTLESLNMRYPETSFVWKVNVNGAWVRTDIKHFMFYKYGMKRVADLSNLRYCTEVEVLDFGHFGVSDLSFIEYMPKLRYLLVLETYVSDLTIVGNCTSLEFLELAASPIHDFWPLTNLTNLKGLNLSHTPYYGDFNYGQFGDITPLLQMTWLERLWLTNSRLGDGGRAVLYDALPNVEMIFFSVSSTDRGWRFAPGYYEMRDILGLWYMVS